MAFAVEELDPQVFAENTGRLRDRLEKCVLEQFPEAVIFGSSTQRVSNTSRIGFKGFVQYENWVELLDLKGFSVSHGSACKAKVVEPSRVLLNMGVPKELALNSIRVSFGPHHTNQDVDDFVDGLKQIMSSKRASSR
jgi:cysteine desulfurase